MIKPILFNFVSVCFSTWSWRMLVCGGGMVGGHWSLLNVMEADHSGSGAAGKEEGDERKWEDKSLSHTHTHTPFICCLFMPATVTVGGGGSGGAGLCSLRMLKANPTGMLQECESWVRDRRTEGWRRNGWRRGCRVKKKEDLQKKGCIQKQIKWKRKREGWVVGEFKMRGGERRTGPKKGEAEKGNKGVETDWLEDWL